MPDRRLTEEEFVVRAIRTLRRPGYRGIHSVYSGFNEAFRRYFGADPVQATTRLASEGKIVIRPSRGGVMLYLPEDGVLPATDPEDALNRILSA
ncbi:MAG: hypothetical protein QN124_11810 [Armatimonadota bacterium]|nr:hypothetical protein [Armatimonadota bacterium]MDR7430784.1 hypothetical protein [Armatimonadota bacterium]